MAEPQVGDKVLYVPDRCYTRGVTDSLFHWHHSHVGVYGVPGDQTHYKAGDKVKDFGQLGKLQGVDEKGHLQMGGGHTVHAGDVKEPWPAEVVAVYPDGCDLVVYPWPKGVNGFYPMVIETPGRTPWTHPTEPPPKGHVPPDKQKPIPHDPSKAPHTFHLPGE